MDLRVRYQPVTEEISDDDEESSEQLETNKTDISMNTWCPWRPWAQRNVSLSENGNYFANIRVKLELEGGKSEELESKGDDALENTKAASRTVIKKEPGESEAIADNVFHMMKGAQDICLFSAIIKTEIEIEVKIEEIEPPESVEKEDFEKESLDNGYLDEGAPNKLTEAEILSETVTSCLAEKPFKCNQCSYTSKYISHLKTHKMIHEGKKPFNCDQCEYTACSQSHIKRHKKKHNGGEPKRRKVHKGTPVNCNQCQFKSFHAKNLKAHKKAHNGNLTFICYQCDYLASCAGNLKRHIMKHSGEKPFKCDICDYSASNAHHVRTHKRKHSGEKPFKCDQCDYAASRTDNLNVHKRNHLGERPFKCHFCDYSDASSRSALRSHVMESHPKEIPSRRGGQ